MALDFRRRELLSQRPLFLVNGILIFFAYRHLLAAMHKAVDQHAVAVNFTGS